MKIAFDNQIFFFEKYGGISRYFTSLIKELIKTNNKYKVFSFFHKNEYLLDFDKSIINGFRFKNYPYKSTRILKFLSSSIDKFRVSQWSPDIIHETFYSSDYSYPKRTPVVITIHDMIHELYPEMFDKNDKTSLNKKIAIDRADKIICVSETTKNDLIKLYNTPKNKISVIHHGITTFSENLKVNQISSKIINEPYLLYVGKRDGYKNFSNYIKSINHNKSLKKDFKLVIFGGGDFTLKEKSLFARLGFSDNNFYYFDGCDTVLKNLLENAVAFIYPSLYEGFGLPLVEAMQFECPIIASNSGSIPEIAQQAAEYFNPNSFESMSEVINNVVYSSDKLKALKINGKDQIKNFSWEKTAQKTNKVYEEIL